MFCPKCKSIMMPSDGKYICMSCGYTQNMGGKEERKVEYKTEKKEIAVISDDSTALPTTKIECPKCGNLKAYWRLEQTRAADEPPTRIYRCTKCGHTWREY